MNLRLDVYMHLDDIGHDHRLDQILTIVKQIKTNTEQIMATLDETLALVTAETTTLDSVIALIDGLVNGSGTAVASASRSVRLVQSGLVRGYALLILGGAVAVFAYLLWF